MELITDIAVRDRNTYSIPSPVTSTTDIRFDIHPNVVKPSRTTTSVRDLIYNGLVLNDRSWLSSDIFLRYTARSRENEMKSAVSTPFIRRALIVSLSVRILVGLLAVESPGGLDSRLSTYIEVSNKCF